jgi:prephenate dehydrogenase
VIEQLAIVGAGGKMGSWFFRYFYNKKDLKKLLVYDINQSSIESLKYKAEICNSIERCVESADIVILCVPIQHVPSLISQCMCKMKAGSILIEISSIKIRSFNALKKVPKCIVPLCIHPMFGSGASDIQQQKILLVPVRNKDSELKVLKDLFLGARIIIIKNSIVHDELVGIVLGLTYYINLVFSNYISTRKHLLPFLKEVSGTSFKMQLMLSQAIMNDDIDLITALLTENPSTVKHIRRYITEENRFSKSIFNANGVGLSKKIKRIKTAIETQDNIDSSYKIMYHLYEHCKQDNQI